MPNSKEIAVELEETNSNYNVCSDETVKPKRFTTQYEPINFREKLYYKSDKGSIVYSDPYDANTPQEVLDKFGLKRKDSSMFPNNRHLPIYGDFTQFANFKERQDLYLSCKEQFDGLPSEIRGKFHNNIVEFAEYVTSDKFDIEYLMTEGFRDTVYKPEKLKKEREFAYQKYLNEKREKEMLENGSSVTS